jgi:hypothetical protein
MAKNISEEDVHQAIGQVKPSAFLSISVWPNYKNQDRWQISAAE